MTIKKTKLEDVLEVISKWEKSNDAVFFGDFVEFDKNGDVTDESKMICYGKKTTIDIMLKEFNLLVKKEKGKFINW